MTKQRFKVGIVGLQPGRSWAARGHVPALRALPESYEIAGVANTNLESSQAAAAAMGLPKAYANVAEMVSAPEIDIVTVTVKVAHHLEIVKAAIEAGKHVYCEWPLGYGLAEAEELAAVARAKGLLGVIGTQARVAPEIEHLKQLRVKLRSPGGRPGSRGHSCERPPCARSGRSPRGSYFYGQTIKDKRPRGHYTAWPLGDCSLGPPEIPSRGT